MKTTLPDQGGVAMLAVLGILLLALSTVWGLFGLVHMAEGLLGYSSDYARTFAAAQALLRDAEADIEGPRSATPADLFAGSAPWFPQTDHEFNVLSDRLPNMPGLSRVAGVRCVQGICIPQQLGDWVGPDSDLSNMIPGGACFAQFSRPLERRTFSQRTLNPVLHTDTRAPAPCRTARAWYWVEMFRYGADYGTDPSRDKPPHPASRPAPAPALLYRITALAQGMRTDTRVVLRTLYMPFTPTLPSVTAAPPLDRPRGVRIGWQQLHD